MTAGSTVPPTRLLVVDDDEEVRHMLTRLLAAEGFRVAEATTGEEVTKALATRPPDLIILDVMLNNENGFDLLTTVRRTNQTPVILLTGRDRENDRVLGLRLGADDYVVKPFSPDELVARVASVLRRSNSHIQTKGPMEFGVLSIDPTTREVHLAGTLVETTAKEFDLLAFLAASPRQVFTREQLLAQVWGSSSSWQDAGTVTEHVRRIRRKLCEDGTEGWIHTVRGIGYRFEP